MNHSFTIRTAIFGLAVMLLAAAAPVSATTYFVGMTGNDANPGTTRTNTWRTIQSAVDRVIPGDTIIILAGTYAGALISTSGSSNAPITLKADAGASVLLNVKNPIGGNATHYSILEFEDWGYGPVSYWIIQGFEIANYPYAGIDIRGAASQPNRGFIVLSNRVHNSVSRGILTSFTDDVLIVGNESYSNGEHGVYCSNSGDRPIVRCNRLHHNADCGLHINADATEGGDGIISDGLVENNIIYSNGTGGAGINMDGVTRTTVRNNLIYASPNRSGIALFRYNAAVSSSENRILNNTILMATNGGWAINLTDVACVSNTILNNIVLSGNASYGSITLPASNLVGFTSDYNVVMNSFSTNGFSASISLAAWQALGRDTHSVLATPVALFVNPTNDFHLRTNSPAIDCGATLPDVPFDMEGTRRGLDGNKDVTNSWDAGLYEYISEVTDSDNDGMKDRAEWIAGTDLLNNGSRLAINAISITAQGNPIMWWTSQVGRVYSILFGTNLITGFVSQATNLSANAPMNVYTAAPSSSAEQFYKVSVTYPGY